MRNFLKRFVAPVILSVLAWSAPLCADDSYLYLSFADSGRVYRLSTNDENKYPTGFIFDCDKAAQAFFVDQFRNFRFLKITAENEFQKTAGYIYRQVFDGAAIEADQGRGHAQHQDQRGELVPGMEARPVFRPEGAPFSAGNGLLVTEGVALLGLDDGEFTPTAERKWFRIPNGSWFQTWFPVAGQPDSLKIFYDCWEERALSCHETIWRGAVPGIVFARQVASGSERRMVRAITDGAMEKLDEYPGLAEVLSMKGLSAFHRPSSATGEGELLVHTWAGRNNDRFFRNGAASELKPLFTSKASNYRAAGILKIGAADFVAVMGNDVFASWLNICGVTVANAECTMAAFSSSHDGSSSCVYVYSRPDRTIYQFRIGDVESGKIELVNTISLPWDIMAMQADVKGNLYFGTLELMPSALKNSGDFVQGFESLQIDEEDAAGTSGISEEEFTKKQSIKRDISGRFVFSQTGNAVVYVIYQGQTQAQPVNSVFLDKKFYARECVLKNVSMQDLHVNAAELLKIAEKPGNSLAELHGSVPGFPDQYRNPESMLIAVRSE
ncbi:MAG TPA: hypothetical protein PLM07_05060 [Candidatus Rifleibacterium sp.]|nr:hypothetical protein [Candidatus Rifleibacterium sp.]HPT45254.1 hypothetical protein [Candidatus Rifleibacterium sp.]